MNLKVSLIALHERSGLLKKELHEEFARAIGMLNQG
jgi:hypothetical protein